LKYFSEKRKGKKERGGEAVEDIRGPSEGRTGDNPKRTVPTYRRKGGGRLRPKKSLREGSPLSSPLGGGRVS